MLFSEGLVDVFETLECIHLYILCIVTGALPRDQYDIMSVHIGGVKIKKLKINILGVY